MEALNRDIKDVLFITASEDVSTLQPDNAIQVRFWPPAPSDCQQLRYIQSAHPTGPKSVRTCAFSWPLCFQAVCTMWWMVCLKVARWLPMLWNVMPI